MIYMEPELQGRLIPAFHYALKPNGVLFLSASEGIGNHPHLFASVNRKWKLYRAVPSAASVRDVMFGSLSWATESGGKAADATDREDKKINIGEMTRRALLQSYAPASVVADIKGNILFVHGETGKYLRPAPGQPTLNVVDMARDGLPLDLRAALHKVANQGIPTLGQHVSVKTNGDFQTVSLSVRQLTDGGHGLLLVSFEDVAPTLAAKSRRRQHPASVEAGRVAELERDLAQTRENLQATIEEQQTSNEELKSTNEEMQSTNEELQSTNEELETSREELQSVNEELITVNAELQAKIEQLAGMQNDMKNLLDNINIGTIFLDVHLIIRRFTSDAMRVYRLVATDIGRPLADIKSDLADDDLIGAAKAVLDSLVPCERELRIGSACYLARIQPYRTVDNVIEGVVLTFTDISGRIKAEAAERRARQLAENIVDTVRESLLVLDGDMTVISASRSFYRRFLVEPEEAIGRRIYDLGDRQWDIPALRQLLETILPRDQGFEGFAVEHEFPAIGHCKMVLNARRIVGNVGERPLILLAIEDHGVA